MRKNVILPALRIDSELDARIKQALKKINSNNEGLEVKIETFRRMAYKHFSQKILSSENLGFTFQ